MGFFRKYQELSAAEAEDMLKTYEKCAGTLEVMNMQLAQRKGADARELRQLARTVIKTMKTIERIFYGQENGRKRYKPVLDEIREKAIREVHEDAENGRNAFASQVED